MPNLAVEPQSGKDQEQELGAMSLLQHLEELRKRVIFSVIAIAVCFGACWKFAGRIYQVVQQPIQKALENHHLDTHLVYLNPTEPFNLYLKIGLIAGIFVASPILLYQVWMFISPGLYRREKKFVLPFRQLKFMLLVFLKYFATIALVVILPLKPLFIFFFVLKLMMPELPAASYFAGGCVIISI